MVEKLDVYDRNKKRTGKIIERKQGVALEKGEYIISVQCWIVNSAKKILLTQRSMNKSHGGMWEPTGGLVQSGESSREGIKRELKEEIGLEIDDDKIELIKEIVEENDDLNFFRDTYLIKQDINVNELIFKDNEVMNAKYVSIEEFSNMIKNNESFDWLDYFKELYKYIEWYIVYIVCITTKL